MGIIGGNEVGVEGKKFRSMVMNHRAQIPGLIVRLSSLGWDSSSLHCCSLELAAEYP